MGIVGYWFADIDEDRPEGFPYPYVACVQVTGAVHQLEGIWFSSEEDCEQFVREEVGGKWGK